MTDMKAVNKRINGMHRKNMVDGAKNFKQSLYGLVKFKSQIKSVTSGKNDIVVNLIDVSKQEVAAIMSFRETFLQENKFISEIFIDATVSYDIWECAKQHFGDSNIASNMLFKNDSFWELESVQNFIEMIHGVPAICDLTDEELLTELTK